MTDQAELGSPYAVKHFDALSQPQLPAHPFKSKVRSIGNANDPAKVMLENKKRRKKIDMYLTVGAIVVGGFLLYRFYA